MKRELRPGLFDFDQPRANFDPARPGLPAPDEAYELFQLSQSAAAYAGEPARHLPPGPLATPGMRVSETDSSGLEKSFKKLSEDFAILKQNFETSQAQWSEILQEKEETIQKLGKFISGVHQKQTQKFIELDARLNKQQLAISEREAVDKKTQELVDRHNQIVRNFENRLTTLTRVMAEQEMHIHQSKEALEEARRELSKIKK